METKTIRNVFRFRARFDALSKEIDRAVAGNLPTQALRLERASLNLAMMERMGVCVDTGTNEVVAFEERTIVEEYIRDLRREVQDERVALLKEVLED